MSNKKKNKIQVITKEELLEKVIGDLNVSLANLKIHFTEKKFKKRIKKVANLLITGIKKIPVKEVSNSRKDSTTRRKSIVRIKSTK